MVPYIKSSLSLDEKNMSVFGRTPDVLLIHQVPCGRVMVVITRLCPVAGPLWLDQPQMKLILPCYKDRGQKTPHDLVVEDLY